MLFLVLLAEKEKVRDVVKVDVRTDVTEEFAIAPFDELDGEGFAGLGMNSFQTNALGIWEFGREEVGGSLLEL